MAPQKEGFEDEILESHPNMLLNKDLLQVIL